MNVEGMPGYDPSKKKTGDMKTLRKPVDRKEYWRMVRGAYAAVLPILLIILLVGVALFAIAWLWLS